VPAARVLVIDDEQMIRWSMEQTLRAAGYEVTTAETAANGVTLFRQLHPAVVFLDLRLPDGDGLQVLRTLKSENGDDTAVVVMTAFGEISTAVEAMRLGAYDYLKKPFDFEELEVLVGRALDTTRLRREVGDIRQERQKTYALGAQNVRWQPDTRRASPRHQPRCATLPPAEAPRRGVGGEYKRLPNRSSTNQGCLVRRSLRRRRRNNVSTLKGLRPAASIPHVPLIICHALGIEQLTELRLKVEPAVMSLLPFDVLLHRVAQRLTHGECPISCLPLKGAQGSALGLCPLRRRAFQLLDPLGHRDRTALPCQAVHMIGAAAQADYWAIMARGYRAKIAMHCDPPGRVVKKGATFFG